MGQEGDDRLVAPVPPPPRPAARRAAIDAALRKFDGIEEVPAPSRRPSLVQWASTHRGMAGGLVTAALIAVISIPAIQVAIRDHPAEVASENKLPDIRTYNEPTAGADSIAAEEPAADQPAPLAKPGAKAPVIAEERSGSVPARRNESAVLAEPSPSVMAPAPPPPPHPPTQAPAKPSANEASDVGNIIVTGSRIPSADAKSSGFAQRAEAPPSPREIAAPYQGFLNRLQGALGDNDRRAVLRLVGLPLRVDFAGGSRTYRTRQDVERDYDRIFTPAVRDAADSLGAGELTSSDGGKLRGSGRIWFGCGLRTCLSEETIRIRKIRP